MTLTELIVREVHFEASGVGQPLYPRFTWATDHPDIRTLDIRDISSWSKTLRPGEKYIDMLRSVYLNRSNPEGLLMRGICIGGMRRQMTVSLMQAAFTGRVPLQHVIEIEKVIVAFGSMQPASPVGEAPGDVRHSALFKLFLRDRLVVGGYSCSGCLWPGKSKNICIPRMHRMAANCVPSRIFVPAVKNPGHW